VGDRETMTAELVNRGLGSDAEWLLDQAEAGQHPELPPVAYASSWPGGFTTVITCVLTATAGGFTFQPR
jgi:hypothetical protein